MLGAVETQLSLQEAAGFPNHTHQCQTEDVLSVCWIRAWTSTAA